MSWHFRVLYDAGIKHEYLVAGTHPPASCRFLRWSPKRT